MDKTKAVIIGAGALGLGFLAQRLASDYDICFADLSSKKEFLDEIYNNRGYIVNICSLDGIEARRVEGNFSIILTDIQDGAEKLESAIKEASLVFTVTGRGILKSIVDKISPAMNIVDDKKWLLFCENGLNIADDYLKYFNSNTTLADTVMSRMCRFADSHEKQYLPMNGANSPGLVVESYSYIPLESNLCATGPFSSSFTFVNGEEFLCWEDIKVYMHNGMHAYATYHSYLENIQSMKDAPVRIRENAQKVMLEEVVPAVAFNHPAFDRDFLYEYGFNLIQRFFNPYFNECVERGVRDVRGKLTPGERLLGGCEYIRKSGIEPVGYSSTIKAAHKILEMGEK